MLTQQGFQKPLDEVEKMAIATRECGFQRSKMAENHQMDYFRQDLGQPPRWVGVC
jgi:hypothetical protein